MRESVFLREIRQNMKNIDTSSIEKKMDTTSGLYKEALDESDLLTSGMSMLVGSLAFLFTGLRILTDSYGMEIGIGSIAGVFLIATVFEVGAWFFKGVAMHTSWKTMCPDVIKHIPTFLKADAMSYIVYVPACILYMGVSFVLTEYLASLAFGAFVFARQWVLFSTLRSVTKNVQNRLILLLAGCGTYLFLLTVFYILVV